LRTLLAWRAPCQDLPRRRRGEGTCKKQEVETLSPGTPLIAWFLQGHPLPGNDASDYRRGRTWPGSCFEVRRELTGANGTARLLLYTPP